jgi:DNA-binding MarR family transcriptional regulator
MASAEVVLKDESTPVDLVALAVEDWARERPDLDTGPMELFARLGRTHRLANVEIERALSAFGLTVSAMDVLLALRRSGEPYRLTPSDLAAVSLLTSGGVTFRLDKLQEAGLIRRVASTEDRRVVWAELTDEGASLADEVVAAHIANEHRLLEAMDADDVATLRIILARLEVAIAASERADR